jgi:phosphatidylglycerol---prolipoprotein diacylglyceryl transferase
MFPIITKIGPFTLHTFGVMLAIAILLGSHMLIREVRRFKDPQITEEKVQKLIWHVVLAVIIGGRLGHVFVNIGDYAQRPLEIFKIWEGGLMMYGGLLATFIVVVVFAYRHNVRILRLCDLVAPFAFLGDAVGRWGCFFAGDDYGKKTTSWVGVKFTHPDSLVPEHLRGVPLHPTQIYMSGKALIIFLVTFYILRRKKFDGQVAGTALCMYAVLRSIVEIFRGDEDRGMVGPLSTSQFVSIFVFAIGLLILILAPRRTLADDLKTKQAA